MKRARRRGERVVSEGEEKERGRRSFRRSEKRRRRSVRRRIEGGVLEGVRKGEGGWGRGEEEC